MERDANASQVRPGALDDREGQQLAEEDVRVREQCQPPELDQRQLSDLCMGGYVSGH